MRAYYIPKPEYWMDFNVQLDPRNLCV